MYRVLRKYCTFFQEVSTNFATFPSRQHLVSQWEWLNTHIVLGWVVVDWKRNTQFSGTSCMWYHRSVFHMLRYVLLILKKMVHIIIIWICESRGDRTFQQKQKQKQITNKIIRLIKHLYNDRGECLLPPPVPGVFSHLYTHTWYIYKYCSLPR